MSTAVEPLVAGQRMNRAEFHARYLATPDTKFELIGGTVDPADVHWHVRQNGRLVRVQPGPDGCYHSQAFPGLWLDPVALLRQDGPAVLAALQQGLATPEHAAFVARLAGDAA